jgi:ribosome-associated heat shock protein Hsp15
MTAGGAALPAAGLRLDKWLRCARFFKTRVFAARACELGRIEVNGRPAKPAREIRPADRLVVRNDSGEYQIEVLLVMATRGPAALAQTMYRESDESRQTRLRVAAERKAMLASDPFHDGKLSKRDRRDYERLRGRDQ